VYRSVIPAGACVLELCASHSSHLPAELAPRLLVGQGMNAQELAANTSLHEWFVQVRCRGVCTPPGPACVCATLALLRCCCFCLPLPLQDLNLLPELDEQLDASFDAVLCVNGLQYLTQPETVLAEVRVRGMCGWSPP
jgi:hypothetical protein